ncbi:MAG: TonB-dependent receptor [Acidobacteria bacterium]|nr:TonB-dependent receptor [Acidobacteriota bacterium]
MTDAAKSPNLTLMRVGLTLLCLSLLLAGTVWGQVYSGSLTGVVTDPSGAVIPGAKVTLTDVGRNIEFPAVTDSVGRYVIRALPPSTYRLRVEVSGFNTYVQDNIVLAVNQSTSIDVRLQVGATTETIEVTVGAALLSTQDAATGQEIQRSFINELPLLGRGVYDLTNLAPGVTQVQGGYIGGGVANNFISNGSRNVQADIIADGATTTNFEQNTGIQTSMYAPSVDMVQEFKLQQSNFSAEIGFSGSTIINLVTRSGTNEFHGTGWWFVRNNILTANSWYGNAAGIKLAPRRYNLFGANVGGPIKKDKLFFFFNYEGLRDVNATTYGAGVPSKAMKKGDFGEICVEGFDADGKCKGDGQLWDPYTGVYDASVGGPVRSGFIPFNRMDLYQSPGSPKLPAKYQLPPRPGNLIDPVSFKMMQYYPDPNYRVGQPDYNRFNNWVGAGSNRGSNNMYDVKIDYAIDPSNMLIAKYSRSPGSGTSGEVWPGTSNAFCSAVNGPSSNINHVFSANYNHTFSPSTILQTTLGWARNKYVREDTIATVEGYDPIKDLGLPEYTTRSGFIATPGIYINDYRTIDPGLTDIGSQPWGIMRQATETHHLVGTLSQLRGKHELKIGGEGRLHRLNYAQPGEPNGVYVFDFNGTSQYPWWGGGDAMATFLTGSAVNGGWGGYEVPVFGATQSYQFAGFIQDNWKVTPKLTLNLGVRYDLNTPRTERFDRGSYLDLEASSPLAGKVPGFPSLKGAVGFIDSNNRHYFAYDKNNFAPRFGFAYQLNPKTVMRGGYGLFYSIVITGASGVGSGFQGFSRGTNWTTTYQSDGATPWGWMRDPFPDGGPLLPVGAKEGASSFLGDSFSGPMKKWVHITPYEQTWTFGFQRELPGNIVLETNYVGKKGTKLYFGGSGEFNYLPAAIEKYTSAQIEDLNTYVPNPFYGLLPTGSPLNTPTVTKQQLMRPYPQYTSLSTLTLPVGNSIYHSFQLRVEKRFSQGLQFLAVYTNQKSIDDSSVGHGGLVWLGGSTSLQNPNNRRLERSLSQYDIPQVLNLSYVYHLPFGRGKSIGSNWNPVVNAILGGWKTNGIWRFSRGQPLALYLSGGQSLPTYGGQRPNLTGILKKNTGANWRDKYFANPEVVVKPPPYTISNAPRTIGSVRTPGINNANLSILKDFYASKVREGMWFRQL